MFDSAPFRFPSGPLAEAIPPDFFFKAIVTMTSPPRFHGVWPAMLTPLDAAGEPNLAAVEQLVELFVDQGLGGLYILGSTGQWPLLRLKHRRAVAERAVRVAAGRIPIIVHVGAVTTEDAVALARHADSIGADAISSVAPIYFPTTVDATFEHYRKIGQATNLPLYVYHLSIVNQIGLGPREYARRVLELPNIAGMKFTDSNLHQLGLMVDEGGEQLQIFSGDDTLVCHAALSGAIGAIGTFYNVWGPAVQRARNAFIGGDFTAGRTFMSAFQNALADILAAQSTWTFLRAAMQLKYGIDVGMPQPPLGALDQPWSETDVQALLERVDAAAPA